jgi:REP element-mobilizing transposase RayT
MARPLRIQYPEAVYHVMNRGSSRQKVFLQKQDYEAFLNTIDEVHDRWGVEVFAYCLMGNHYHVCLCTPEENLARVMRHLMDFTLSDSTDFTAATVLVSGGGTRRSWWIRITIWRKWCVTST